MLQQIWNGLSTGALYGLVAVGYTLIFGIIQVIFFAQGELSMIAAFAAALTLVALESIGVGFYAGFPVAVVVAIFASCSIGLLAERVALRPLRGAPRVKALISSLAVTIILQNAVMLTAGPQSHAFHIPVQTFGVTLAGVSISAVQVAMLAISVTVVFGIQIFLWRHKYGLAIRAIGQSPVGARLMGINENRTVMVAFLISSTTAALGGVLMAAYNGALRFDMGFVPGIKGFTIAIVGGVGNLRGAFLAGLLVGIAEAMFAGYVSSSYRDLLVMVILITTLVFRPQGLMGKGS